MNSLEEGWTTKSTGSKDMWVFHNWKAWSTTDRKFQYLPQILKLLEHAQKKVTEHPQLILQICHAGDTSTLEEHQDGWATAYAIHFQFASSISLILMKTQTAAGSPGQAPLNTPQPGTVDWWANPGCDWLPSPDTTSSSMFVNRFSLRFPFPLVQRENVFPFLIC